MKLYIKRGLLIGIAAVVSMAAFSQISVQLKAPRQAMAGAKMAVRYVVNSSDVDNFSVGDFEGFDVLFGPSTSTQTSFSMINGKTSNTSSTTYTYTVVPTKEGVHTLPPATAVVDGKSYSSKTAQIEVLPADQQSAGSGSGSGGNGGGQGGSQAQGKSQSNAAIGDKDIYMDVSLSKTKVYEQEAVLVTYKLYTLVDVQQIAGEMPQLDACHVQEIDAKAQMQLKYEQVNGRTYGTALWRQYVLYPQKSGTLTVPGVTFDTQIVVTNKSMDPFDLFFGGGSLSQVVKKQLKTPAKTIEVTALPSPRPGNFNGAVGSYSFSGSLTPQQLKANDAASLRLVVSGQGNMHLMKSPVVNFPKDFEVYDPRKEEKISHSAQGAKGNVVYDYVVVPRHGGSYDIPAVEFCYFDPAKKEYKTLRTEAYHVSVEKSANEGSRTVVSQEELRVLSNDIRFIKLGPVQIAADSTFFNTTAYWTVYATMLVVFVVLLVVFRRYVRESANTARTRNRRAGKAASRRLRNADALMQKHDSAAFFDEVMRALLGYAGDKLGLHTSDLNKDNVRQALTERGVEQGLIDSYLDVVSQCEFARFAPGDPDATMERIFASAAEALNRLNGILK